MNLWYHDNRMFPGQGYTGGCSQACLNVVRDRSRFFNFCSKIIEPLCLKMLQLERLILSILNDCATPGLGQDMHHCKAAEQSSVNLSSWGTKKRVAPSIL